MVRNCSVCFNVRVCMPSRSEKCHCWQQAGRALDWGQLVLLCTVLIKIRMHRISGQKTEYYLTIVT